MGIFSRREKWLSFDLGSECNISRYIIRYAGSCGYDKSLNTRDFVVMISSDNKSWKAIDKVKDNSDSVIDKDFEEKHKARYVKILIKNAGEDGVARIADVEIFGTRVS